eukprot:m.287115 g.287115  ORF g.287115 m.287115 type:complete len:258 (+) comp11714_c0_seq1:66-839(+)
MLRVAARILVRSSSSSIRMASSSSVAGGEPIEWKRATGESVPGRQFGDASQPGVIVLQEWWGIDEEIIRKAEIVAGKNFHVVVPDLYRGKRGVEAEEAEHLMNDLDWKGAIEDVRGAVQYLRGDNADKKVAVMGFCMGGALSLASGVHIPELSACIPFYGIPPEGLADPTKLTVPIQGHFGADDNYVGFASKQDAEALAAKVKGDIFIYDNAGHAFMNDTQGGIERKSKLGQGSHNQAAIDQAWERTFEFLNANLRK